MTEQSDGEARPEDTLANDSVRYLLLRMQLPSLQEVKALDRRRRQTAKIVGTDRQIAEHQRALQVANSDLRIYAAVTVAALFLWTITVSGSERGAGFAAFLYVMVVVAIGAGIVGGGYQSYNAFMTRRSHRDQLEHLEAALDKMATAIAPRLSIERVVDDAKRSFPKFDAERRRIEGVKETIKVLRSNVASFWWDVIFTMQEAERREVEANIEPSVRAEAQQYLFAWGQPPMLVDLKAEPRFGWTGYTDEQLREWDHWSHLVASASGCRRAMSAMGVPLATSGPVQLPPEILPHSNRWQEGHDIPVGQGVTNLQDQPVADFEAALHFGEGPSQSRFLSLVAPDERSQVDELLSSPSAS